MLCVSTQHSGAGYVAPGLCDCAITGTRECAHPHKTSEAPNVDTNVDGPLHGILQKSLPQDRWSQGGTSSTANAGHSWSAACTLSTSQGKLTAHSASAGAKYTYSYLVVSEPFAVCMCSNYTVFLTTAHTSTAWTPTAEI